MSFITRIRKPHEDDLAINTLLLHEHEWRAQTWRKDTLDYGVIEYRAMAYFCIRCLAVC